jgi:hypothetical protein
LPQISMHGMDGSVSPFLAMARGCANAKASSTPRGPCAGNNLGKLSVSGNSSWKSALEINASRIGRFPEFGQILLQQNEHRMNGAPQNCQRGSLRSGSDWHGVLANSHDEKEHVCPRHQRLRP